MDDNAYESVVAEHYKKRNRCGSHIQKFFNKKESKTRRWMFRDSFGAHSAPVEVASILWKVFDRKPPVTSMPNGILIDKRMGERQSMHCDDKAMYCKIAGKFLLL
jgi:hypothetical protein